MKGWPELSRSALSGQSDGRVHLGGGPGALAEPSSVAL